MTSRASKYFMDIIRQNPYHIIGVLAGASERTISKQNRKINAFIKVGKKLEFDTDILLNGFPDRSEAAVEKAEASIEINQDELLYALFWFTKLNHLDETAFNYLRAGDIRKAEMIWEKTTKRKKISAKNFSAFNNLGTLKLATTFLNGTLIPENFEEGVNLKMELITSEYFRDFCHLVTDETYAVDPEKELRLFAEALLDETEKLKIKDRKITHQLLRQVHPWLTSIISDKLSSIAIRNIESSIELTKKNRRKNSRSALELGLKLHKETKKDLATLKEVIGKSDLRYQLAADKLAEEILQCGIDYFNEYRDYENSNDVYLGEVVKNLFQTAKQIVCGAQVNARITESIGAVQEWIDDTESRRQRKPVEDEIEHIRLTLEEFQELIPNTDNVEILIKECNPALQKMKEVLGSKDEIYIQISSAVANNAQNMLITAVNQSQEHYYSFLERIEDVESKFSSQSPLDYISLSERERLYSQQSEAYSRLKSTLSKALYLSMILGRLDMDSELRERHTKNHSILSNISTQLSISITEIKQKVKKNFKQEASSRKTSDKSGTLAIISLIFILVSFIILYVTKQPDNKKTSLSDIKTEQIENSEDSDKLIEDYEASDEEIENNKESNEEPGLSKENEYIGNQLPTGTSPYDEYFGKGVYNNYYNNWIEFKNGNNLDAIICLVHVKSNITIRNEYIQAGTNLRMTNIPNGTYFVKVFYGKDWNPNKLINNGLIKGGFEKNSYFSKSDRPEDWLYLDDDGYSFSTYQITLYSVSNGNMSQQYIDESEFF